ncbi:hypothetical protein L3V82_04350 [Thiotrichales bacterium 19S3-7]|nr:hypothetical protein [Thiotrichales bacterium 19S3-7]MCF6801325.1 hypothetical protein [Thiotrichales bacterium 19S3-11]
MTLESKMMLEKLLIIGVPTIILIVNILFTLSVYRLLKLVRVHQRVFPLWMLIPTMLPFAMYFILMLLVVIGIKVNYALLITASTIGFFGYIFMWIVYPFAISRTLKKHIDTQVQFKGVLLFRLGILMVLLPLGCSIPSIDVAFFIAVLIVWISYWVIIARTKRLIRLKWKNY